MKNFDLSLGQWGHYNKNYSGSCHVADAENGIGFVFSLFPGFYRRNVMIPRTICDNGVKIMDASTDLSRYRYRYELMWKDVVYLDADYISNGNILDLSCKFVNNTDIAQTLILNCCGYLQFPTLNRQPLISTAPVGDGKFIAAADYSYIKMPKTLMNDGLKLGETRKQGFVRTSALDFSKLKGDDFVRYDFDALTADRIYLRLKAEKRYNKCKNRRRFLQCKR